MRLLTKASIEKSDFYNLIGSKVTFSSDIILVGGQTLHKKDDKAIISDVEYTTGHYHGSCPDIWITAKLSTFSIEGYKGISYVPDTFVEFKNT